MDPTELEDTKPNPTDKFIDVETIGLRRSKRIKDLKEAELKVNEETSKSMGFLTMAADSKWWHRHQFTNATMHVR